MKINRIFFMVKKFIRDVGAEKEPYKISEDLFSEKLGEYYFLFEENPAKLNRLITGFDNDGIPVNSAYIDVENAKKHYYPISIGQYGLAVFDTFIKTPSEDKKNHFIRIADWFLLNKIEEPARGTFWLTDIPKPEYKVSKPWVSAFTQSRAISILLRAWQITGKSDYFNAAAGALKIYEIEHFNGGVTVTLNNCKFFEEYPAEKPTMVLDGHIFSLLGLYDFYRATKELFPEESEKSLQLFNEGVNGLLSLIKEYDMGFWLKFNLCKMDHYPETDPCTIGYLRLIVLQLKLLFKLTTNVEFSKYSEKFSSYDKLSNIIRMYPYKFVALKKLKRL